MNPETITPTFENVVVRVGDDIKSEHGILLSDAATVKGRRAEVLALGPDVDIPVAVGDFVHFRSQPDEDFGAWYARERIAVCNQRFLWAVER